LSDEYLIVKPIDTCRFRKLPKKIRNKKKVSVRSNIL
jgi:hypothetical protein